MAEKEPGGAGGLHGSPQTSSTVLCHWGESPPLLHIHIPRTSAWGGRQLAPVTRIGDRLPQAIRVEDRSDRAVKAQAT